MMDGDKVSKIYQSPMKLLLNAINDLVELQHAEVTYADIELGKIYFKLKMYGFVWEYRFTVEELGASRSRVTLEIEGKVTDKQDRIRRQLALLDSMLPGARDAPD